MDPKNWEPILSGEMLADARAALADIGSDLRSGGAPLIPIPCGPEVARATTAGLLRGHAGQSLYFAYSYRASRDERDADTAFHLLDGAVEVVSSVRMAPGLFEGFSGILWVASHLAGLLFPASQEESFADADVALLGFVKRRALPVSFDLIEGLVGVGVYALERRTQESARRCLEAIVDRLEESAEPMGCGIAWVTSPESYLTEFKERFPGGTYDLGMAHGVPGVVALLAALWTAGVSREQVGPLLQRAVAWILDRRMPSGSPSRFPYWHSPGSDPVPARTGWCYGDPGVAIAILRAATAMSRSDWRDEALRTARIAGWRPFELSGVRDAGLCHGSAGIAHLLNRLYQASGDEALKEAALLWYRRLLDARRPGQGSGGYLFETGIQGSQPLADPGFLNGSAGVGLALLAATTSIEPGWDRALFADVRPGIAADAPSPR